MRILFTTFAAKVHMYSQVSLAWALRTAGHEVCIASQPDMVEDITRTGLTGVGVGEALDLEERMKQVDDNLGDEETRRGSDGEAELDLTEMRPEMLTHDYLLGMFTAMTAVVFQNQCPEPMVDDLVTFARTWKPDLVIWDTLTFAGPVAAKASGAAHARLLFGLDHVGRTRRAFLDELDRLPPELRDDPQREWLTWTLERYGCEFDEDTVTGNWTIDPTPAWIRFPLDLNYIPMRYVPYNGPSTVPEWLYERPKRKRICLTLGLSHREVQGGDEISIADLFEAVDGLDAEVVATFDPSQVKSLRVPDNVRAVDFVPLNDLLPTCSAIVSHGGSGTFATALRHGVPQLILPSRIWDSTYKAERLEEQGAGMCVQDAAALSPKELRERLVRLLEEPSYARSAAMLRQELIGTPSPNAVVPALEKLTAEHRPSR
ncbi:activator-dependent family glycosyltransferase [Spirillospora sp. NPDC047279]|uniref:activator-dependent family glycosyltransferase n=1 Tax=Spirillospora sp. NPDC047279 TaxID=3155478 RepID=UPI0033EE4CD9